MYESLQKATHTEFEHILIVGTGHFIIENKISKYVSLEAGALICLNFDGKQYPEFFRAIDHQLEAIRKLDLGYTTYVHDVPKIEHISGAFYDIIKRTTSDTAIWMGRPYNYYYKMSGKDIHLSAINFFDWPDVVSRMTITRAPFVRDDPRQFSENKINTSVECAADSIMAVAMSTIKNVSQWNEVDLKRIVEGGGELYRESSGTNSNQYLKLEHAKKTFTFNKIKFEITEVEMEHGDFFGHTFLESNDNNCILVSNRQHVAIFKRGNDFYLFDSNGRGTMVFNPNFGGHQEQTIALMKLKGVDDFDDVLQSIFGDGQQFHCNIYTIDIKKLGAIEV